MQVCEGAKTKTQKHTQNNNEKFSFLKATHTEGDTSVVYGKHYYEDLTELYVTSESLFEKLAAKPGDESEVDVQLMEANFLLKNKIG